MSLSYPLSKIAIEQLKIKVIDALKSVYDPEIRVNIYDLGLIYTIAIDPQGSARLEMTLTTPNCPVAETLPSTVNNAVAGVDGITDSAVELVWDPPWTTEKVSEAAKLELGIL